MVVRYPTSPGGGGWASLSNSIGNIALALDAREQKDANLRTRTALAKYEMEFGEALTNARNSGEISEPGFAATWKQRFDEGLETVRLGLDPSDSDRHLRDAWDGLSEGVEEIRGKFAHTATVAEYAEKSRLAFEAISTTLPNLLGGHVRTGNLPPFEAIGRLIAAAVDADLPKSKENEGLSEGERKIWREYYRGIIDSGNPEAVEIIGRPEAADRLGLEWRNQLLGTARVVREASQKRNAVDFREYVAHLWNGDIPTEEMKGRAYAHVASNPDLEEEVVAAEHAGERIQQIKTGSVDQQKEMLAQHPVNIPTTFDQAKQIKREKQEIAKQAAVRAASPAGKNFEDVNELYRQGKLPTEEMRKAAREFAKGDSVATARLEVSEDAYLRLQDISESPVGWYEKFIYWNESAEGVTKEQAEFFKNEAAKIKKEKEDRKNDPVGMAIKRDKFNVENLDMSDLSGSLRKRVVLVDQISVWAGVSASVLTREEAENLRELWNEGGAQVRMKLLEDIAGANIPRETLSATWQMLGEKREPLLNYSIAMINAGESGRVDRILRGHEFLRTAGVGLPLREDYSRAKAEALAALGGSAGDPDMYASLSEAIDGAYIFHAMDMGKDLKEYKSDVFKKAIRDAFSGVGDVNGKMTLIPEGWDEGKVETFVRSSTSDDLSNLSIDDGDSPVIYDQSAGEWGPFVLEERSDYVQLVPAGVGGEYTFVAPLPDGGMGEVRSAKDPSRKFAFKLPEEWDGEWEFLRKIEKGVNRVKKFVKRKIAQNLPVPPMRLPEDGSLPLFTVPDGIDGHTRETWRGWIGQNVEVPDGTGFTEQEWKSLTAQIASDEAFRSEVYLDSSKPPKKTIGFGTNIEIKGREHLDGKVIGVEEGMEFLVDALEEGVAELRRSSKVVKGAKNSIGDIYNKQPGGVRIALANMVYNMGLTRVGGFKNMWKALDRGDYEQAAWEVLNVVTKTGDVVATPYARETKLRARRVAAMIAEGA